MYKDELLAAELEGVSAFDAMEAWVSAPADAAYLPGKVLEGYARTLRQSRERIRRLLDEHGKQNDILEALAKNEEYHRALGLSMPDKPEPDQDAQ